MKNTMRKFPTRLGGAALLVSGLCYAAGAHASCGASYCLVNTDWAMQGAWLESGPRFDLRYEQLAQRQLMDGAQKVETAAINPNHRELETVSRRWLANVDYGFDNHWGMTASIPFLDRSHAHIENGERVTWDYRQFGDVRVATRYQSAMMDSTNGSASVIGASLGLKLPSGRTDIANQTGTRAERSLQPGSGSLDVIGSFYYRKVLPDLASSWFVQANIDLPIREKDAYRPGNIWGLDLGIRGTWTDKVSPMLQLNFQHRDRDSGSNAEPAHSGGQNLWLSPGLSVKVAAQAQIYGFVQVPVYQYVNGEQLSPKWAVSLGMQSKF